MRSRETMTVAALCAALLAAPACGSKKSKSEDDGERPAARDAAPAAPKLDASYPTMPPLVVGDEVVFEAPKDARATDFELFGDHVAIVVEGAQSKTALEAVPLGGGKPVRIADDAESPVSDGEHLYFVRRGEAPGIYRVAAVGKDPEKLVAEAPNRIAVGAGDVFWGRRDEVVAVPKAGGEPRVVAKSSRRVRFLTTGPDNIYWAGDEVRDPRTVIGWIERAPIAGGEAAPVVSDIADPGSSIAFGDGALYYSSGDPPGLRSLMATPVSGSAPPVKRAWPVDAFFVDGGDVYAAMSHEGLWGIYALADDGARPRKLGQFTHGRATRVAADRSHVYWLHEGIVYRTEK